MAQVSNMAPLLVDRAMKAADSAVRARRKAWDTWLETGKATDKKVFSECCEKVAKEQEAFSKALAAMAE